MLKKLRIKFVCINMSIVTVMLCIIFGTILHFTQKQLETQSVQMMRAAGMEPAPPDVPQQLHKPDNQDDNRPEAPISCFTLKRGEDGELEVTGEEYFDLSDEQFLSELLDAAAADGKDTGILREYRLRYRRMMSPQGEYMAFADAGVELATIEGLWRSCLLIGFVSFAAFLVISLFLAKWAVKPVEKAWQQQRRFIADASHELKVPLTVIMTNTELLQAPECTAQNHTRFLNGISTMAHQMRGLVESLLELARLDNGTSRITRERMDLSQTAEDAVLPFEAIFFEKELYLESDIEPGICVQGSESHLRQVIDIFLDNAQKYSFEKTTVTLRLKRSGRAHCLLSVTSVGNPISKEDLKNIFQRFYRVDEARSLKQSYGLGLSIAEQIVMEHGGKIWAESEDGSNTFYVQLPIL